MMSMTPEEISQYVNEVWEDDEGYKRILKYFGSRLVVYASSGKEHVTTQQTWMLHNNLPQSLRKAKPRMVKVPINEWTVWCGEGCGSYRVDSYAAQKDASNRAKHASDMYKNVAIQAPNSDEMEVVKGFCNE